MHDQVLAPDLTQVFHYLNVSTSSSSMQARVTILHMTCISCLQLWLDMDLRSLDAHNAQLIRASMHTDMMCMLLVHTPRTHPCALLHISVPPRHCMHICASEVDFTAHIYWYDHTHAPWTRNRTQAFASMPLGCRSTPTYTPNTG